jgi:hypothetical protein
MGSEQASRTPLAFSAARGKGRAWWMLPWWHLAFEPHAWPCIDVYQMGSDLRQELHEQVEGSRSLHHDCYPLGAYSLLDGQCNLAGKSLLYL